MYKSHRYFVYEDNFVILQDMWHFLAISTLRYALLFASSDHPIVIESI